MSHLSIQKQFKIHQLLARQQTLTTLLSPHRPMSNIRMTTIQNHKIHNIEILSNPKKKIGSSLKHFRTFDKTYKNKCK